MKPELHREILHLRTLQYSTSITDPQQCANFRSFLQTKSPDIQSCGTEKEMSHTALPNSRFESSFLDVRKILQICPFLPPALFPRVGLRFHRASQLVDRRIPVVPPVRLLAVQTQGVVDDTSATQLALQKV